ncbi:hypothetical protein AJ79_01172 [Helicocarpus griseus UAMH5409]|uniref:Nicotinamide N-methyltransferase n=1 Tax=Helicocarpus griseus UAMH5409 TaxID=1447875 RepID=A0A2B7Y864_9EURO|nr:hypothetical protein AJ79_01172 [Helicocarpus griseus UAMH5409]
MLVSRIKPLHAHSAPHPTAERPSSPSPSSTSVGDDAEDLFTSFLPHLFPDEAPPCLGDPGKAVIYASDVWGDVTVMVPDYPKGDEQDDTLDTMRGGDEDGREGAVEEGRRLFAHYLWGGGLVIAEGIERAIQAQGNEDGGRVKDLIWNVDGETVLEVGAGAALPSLISALAGAAQIAITDHPSSPALYGSIQANINKNIPEHLQRRIAIQPHEWGVLGHNEGQVPGNPQTAAASKFALENKGAFTKIIAADCLWMRDQHENLVKSLLWFLAPPLPDDFAKGEKAGGGSGGVAWVVAGFHTGRGIVASFFETAVAMGLVVEKIWERDVNATSEEGEVMREWMPVRPGEGPENRARWCVVAFLRKKGD